MELGLVFLVVVAGVAAIVYAGMRAPASKPDVPSVPAAEPPQGQ